MILEARAAHCFSSTHMLKLDDRPIGKYENQWFSEYLTIHLIERRCLEFRKIHWFGNQFELVDLAGEEVLGQCKTGFFSRNWEVNLSIGPGQLLSSGWFNSSYELIQDERALARVDRLGWCERGWIIDGSGILAMEDLLLIGLIYHTIMVRQQSHAGGDAAGS